MRPLWVGRNKKKKKIQEGKTSDILLATFVASAGAGAGASASAGEMLTRQRPALNLFDCLYLSMKYIDCTFWADID